MFRVSSVALVLLLAATASAYAVPRLGGMPGMMMGQRLVSHTAWSCGMYCDYSHDCSIAGGPCTECVFDPTSSFYHTCGGGSCGTRCTSDHDCHTANGGKGPCRYCEMNNTSHRYLTCAH